MKLSEILNESCFGTIATIDAEESINKLQFFLECNKAFINNFKHVLVSLNFIENTSSEVIDQYKKIWSENVPNAVFLIHNENKGHMFGTIDLEESIFTFITDNYKDVRYIWKSMDDFLLSENLFDVEVPNVGFYYLPGFSYESIYKAGGKDALFENYENYENGFWTPQTTFFILNISTSDNLYGSDILDKYKIYLDHKKNIPEIKPWDIKFDIKFDCETHLGRTTKDISKYCLLGENKFKELLDFVDFNRIGDPSHKNIYFIDLKISHYHFYNDLVFNI
jgi:hypothetical protein